MKKLDIRFFAPSYKRPYQSSTQVLYPFVTLVVAESEFVQYRQNNSNVIFCPDNVQGNLCRVRNWILKENADADCVILLDDDCRGIMRWKDTERVKVDADELQEFAEMATIMAMDSGVKLWGVNPNPRDKGSYREHIPLNFLAYIGGPFQAHVKTDLFYDESLPLKEDYDLTLQHIHKYRKVLRFNQYIYNVKQAEQSGGCATYRTDAFEREQFLALQRKWGAKVVGTDKRSQREFDINPRISLPYKGV